MNDATTQTNAPSSIGERREASDRSERREASAAPPSGYEPASLRELSTQIEALRQDALARERNAAEHLEQLAPRHRESGRNLAHYLAVRSHDIRELQRELHRLGLSSLGRIEAYTLASLDAVARALRGLRGEPFDSAETAQSATLTFEAGRSRLQERATELLGPPEGHRSARIMVTMDNEMIGDTDLVQSLVEAGTNAFRVNLAKGDEDDWRGRVGTAREAARCAGREVKVFCDLEGPNPRTGPIASTAKGKPGFRLAEGDIFRVTRDSQPGRSADDADDGVAHLGCDTPRALACVQEGHEISFDDGRLTGIVETVGDEALRVRVTHAKGGSTKLKPGKSMNLPDSDIDLPTTSEQDLHALDSIGDSVDGIGLSFVRTPQDVDALGTALDERDLGHLGIVLKIETRTAFRRLPRLLMAAMKRDAPVGAMVARGDMGVELGFKRMAEAQEETLWICEAAHTPVIWATQVLENLAKRGLPARAEVTDAAMGGRAECVMLNKGPNITRTVAFLDDVLGRLYAHQDKKVQLMRQLSISEL